MPSHMETLRGTSYKKSCQESLSQVNHDHIRLGKEKKRKERRGKKKRHITVVAMAHHAMTQNNKTDPNQFHLYPSIPNHHQASLKAHVQ